MLSSARVLLKYGVCFVILVGCAAREPAEIQERRVFTQAEQDERIGGQFVRVVQSGDTLFSIAFALGLDVNKIAAWNDISDTSKLVLGKKIRLTEPVGFVFRSQRKIVPKRPSEALSKKAKPRERNIPAVAAQAETQPKTSPSIGNRSTPKLGKSSPAQAKDQNARASQPTENREGRPILWQWPLRGTLVGRFNLAKGQQGIEIEGQRGQIVKASASGEVVYAGDSLKGYGNLVIIKHSADYLSAYAHNEAITVVEGQMVNQGQGIAKLGLNLRGLSASQFQIRKNGNPVDPMLFLK